MSPRSFLFVPGGSEKKLARGADSGADALILDLEDSVAPERKAIARGMVLEYLRTAHGGPELWVRINPMSDSGLDDVVAVVQGAPAGLMVPWPRLAAATGGRCDRDGAWDCGPARTASQCTC